MFYEIAIGVVSLVGFAVYFVVSKNKREKIDFRGKHVVITGGSSGIGYDLSMEAFKLGANVSIVARNRDKLESVLKELEDMKSKNSTLSSQIVQIESIDISKNYEETKKAFDRVNYPFNFGQLFNLIKTLTKFSLFVKPVQLIF